MGCGRSRHSSTTSKLDSDQTTSDSKENFHKKNNNKQDRKENKDPSVIKPLLPKGGSSKKEKLSTGNKKLSPDSVDSPTKSQSQWLNGSSQSPKSGNSNGIKTDKFHEGKSKTAFKDRSFTGNKPNVQITGSQLEFFRMLDERIEQGRDYSDD
ncbi:hypothetical protein LOTGIDRAFT_174767 [Lottia gigantea]|uniref:Uncharacterized protein n=1 Tax=Lottia gigantea TaxID=225164 RepID=V3ZYQ1_LOTGI|nr:hypothetical protein LOTGIDRAFT_174767 [Lottia gigantea]ESO96663.1 hypothetical protein LOTGIDRAFT_174767 [Lottia gigantea]